jgi:hypothetical protein
MKFANTLSQFFLFLTWEFGRVGNEKYVFTMGSAAQFFFLGTNLKIVNNKAHHIRHHSIFNGSSIFLNKTVVSC